MPVTAEGRHDLDAMAAAITDRTKVVIVCTPILNVRRVFESEQPAFQRSLSRVPKNIREWLSAEAAASEADRADDT